MGYSADTFSFFLAFFSIGSILLSLTIISFDRSKDINQNSNENCISDNCTLREMIKGSCIDVYTVPNCCSNLTECFECQNFDVTTDPLFILEDMFVNEIDRTNCSIPIYIQDSFIENDNLIVKCFGYVNKTVCNSTFHNININDTAFFNKIEALNSTIVNLNGLLIDSSNVTTFNATNAFAKIKDIIVNGTVFANEIQSCTLDETIIINGITFYSNGTVTSPYAIVNELNLTSMNTLNIVASVIVQGFLIQNGTIQGYLNDRYSNAIFQNQQMNVAVNVSNTTAPINSKLLVNGDLGTNSLLFINANNTCTNVTNCLLDAYYRWDGHSNVSGLANNTQVPLSIVRIGKWVRMQVYNITDYVSSPVLISMSLMNSTGPNPLNTTYFINTSRTFYWQMNFWIPSLDIIPYGIMKLDPTGVLTITMDPYYSNLMNATQVFWNTFSVEWSLF